MCWSLDFFEEYIYYKDKEFVRLASPETLIGTNISVNEQFPSEIEQRRKVLYPFAKNSRRNRDNKVRLVRDKLFINGQQYTTEENRNATQHPSNHRQNSAPMYSMHRQSVQIIIRYKASHDNQQTEPHRMLPSNLNKL